MGLVVGIRSRAIRVIMKTIILASASPRRKEILEKTGLKFKVYESDYEENMEIGLKPHELAICHSIGKAMAIARKHKNALIISADTIVVFKNRVFGKPRDKEDAREMLKALSGKAHTVILYTSPSPRDGLLSRMP